MHKESLMTTPAVSVTVFNPPEEKRSKKAGGGGNTSASDHIGSTFTMIEEETFSPREGLISAIKSLDLAKNQEEVGILRRKIKESYAKTSENYPHEVKFIPKDIKSVLDNYKFGDSSFKALKKLNKTKRAEGSLMVPREGLAVGGGVVKLLKRSLQEMLKDPDLIPSKKRQKERQDQIMEAEMYYPDEAKEAGYHIAMLEPYLKEESTALGRALDRVKKRIYKEIDDNRVADDTYAGVLLNLEETHSKLTKEVRSINAEERIAQSEIDAETVGLSPHYERELEERRRIEMLKPEYKEKKLKERASRDDISFQEGGMAGGSLMVPREGYALGSVVSKLVKRVLSSQKRMNKLDAEGRVYLYEGFDGPSFADSDLTNLEHEDVVLHAFNINEKERKLLEEKFGEKFSDPFSNISYGDLTKKELTYIAKNDNNLKETFDSIDAEIEEGMNEMAQKQELAMVEREPSTRDIEEYYDKQASTKDWPGSKSDDDIPFQEGGMADEQVGQFVGANEGTAPVDTYPNIPPEEMAAAQASQLPDNEMEDTYIDFILDESLNPEEQTYLMNSLEADPQLSVIFDKLIGTASEFSGAGEVEGPGTGVSDSIPARLSDGEFVMTKKATDAIGAENLQTMMDEGERAYDNDGGKAIKMAFGGMIEKDELEDSKNYLSKTDEEIKKVMIGANKMPSVR